MSDSQIEAVMGNLDGTKNATDKPLSPSMVEGLEQTNQHVKRMNQDEAYRKEVAKDLS